MGCGPLIDEGIEHKNYGRGDSELTGNLGKGHKFSCNKNYKISEEQAMLFRATKKLIDTYKIIPAKNVAPEDSFYSWHCNVFYVNKWKCILFMNDASRFSVAIFNVTQKIFNEALDDFFVQLFENTLLAEKVEQNKIDEYFRRAQTAYFTTTANSSVIANMNQMVRYIDWIVEKFIKDGILHSKELNIEINHYLFSAISDYPYNAFIKKLNEMDIYTKTN
ncbi:MAG: hypothetical protein LBQ47_05935 [Endomicrobium sp.]|nr:hypothetical protein [Endomicrobium sp.]